MWYNQTGSLFQQCNLFTSRSGVYPLKANPGFFLGTGAPQPAYAINEYQYLLSVTSSLMSGSFSASLSKKIDSIGNVQPYNYYRGVSTDTIRVMESLHHISQSFTQSFSGSKVVEFGSSLGNLVIGTLQFLPEIGTYYCLDFAPVQSASITYVSSAYSAAMSGASPTNIIYANPESPTVYSNHLFISEYAFSENNSSSLYNPGGYYDKYIASASYCFLRINFDCYPSGSNSGSYYRYQFINLLKEDFNITLYQQEDPKYRSSNYLVAGVKI